jgi:predicted transcriptional regulator
VSLKIKKMANRNRSSLDIVREVLNIAITKVCKTRIMYGANLSFHQLEKYLRALLANNLLSFDEDYGYLTTSSGKEFLDLYTNYLEHSTRLKGEVEKNTKTRHNLEKMCGFESRDPQK